MDKNIHFVIIDYFKAERVIEVVDHLTRQNYGPENFYISVIDNSCSDTNFKKLQSELSSSVKLVRSTENIGYTKAANKLVAECEWNAEIICLLNPDIIFDNADTLSTIVDNFDDPSCFIVGPAQVNDDGTTPSIVRDYPTPLALLLKRSPFRSFPIARGIVDKYLMPDFDSSKKQTVPWIQSSCVFISRAFWDAIGGLNTDYFLFMSDIEICKKAYAHGGLVIYDPTIKVIADGKRCSEGGIMSLFKSASMRHHVKDALRYYLRSL